MIKLAMVYPSRVKETKGEELLYSPLALGYLARHTPDYYHITLYDEYVGTDLDPDTVDADLVAVSAITPGISRAYEIGDRLRKRGIKTIIGGAHVTALPDEALQHFDTVCQGEGESPWREYLKDYEKGHTKQTYYGPMNVSLENLGTPRRDMCHPNYQYPSVLTSRGCAYGCSFCYLTVFKERKYRTIPHDTILEDLDMVKDNFAVIVTDENFIGYSEKDMEDRKILMEKIIRKKYKFVWGCQATTTLAAQPELMDLMYRSGCRGVFIGFESSADDEEGLKQIRKHHNIGLDYTEIMANLHKHNLAVIASTILGLDSHTKEYPKKLIKELKKAKADFPRVFFATAWPGTPLFESLEKEGRANRNWDEIRKDVPSIKFKHFTHEEAIAARKEILDAFFNVFSMSKVIANWIFKDRTLLLMFIKMSIRNRIAEIIKRRRQYKSEDKIKRPG
ncbi:MAG: radical SAM protein [Candidatus Aminicenantales bacterium]